MSTRKNRAVVERWFIEGTLELVTPTSLSNGDDDPLVDLPIVVDALAGKALLTGASLAGALRAYLADCGDGYAKALFGGERSQQQDDDTQSPLIVDDALGDTPLIELRDGVSIDPATRTARENERYDRQLLAAGTTFNLGFELIITDRDNKETLRAALAAALDGLQRGDIRLGGRKRRGYGQCEVTGWQAWRYDLSRPEGIRGWLAHGRPELPDHQVAHWEWPAANGGRGILDWAALGGVATLPRADEPFKLSAMFDIDGSVLIRSGFEAESGPDVMHLRSRRGEGDVPVMSGTSLAGVIRGQALRIARTVAGNNRDEADDFIKSLFGGIRRPNRDMTPKEREAAKKEARSSRVTVDESVITGPPKDIVQTRVKIDRFTGGAFESALFAEQPAFGGGFTLKIALRPPPPPKPDKNLDEMTPEEKSAFDNKKIVDCKKKWDAEVGLLLLVLKDLWTGFLPVGGASSVGRGRLKGTKATLHYDSDEWTLTAAGQDGESITVTSGKGTSPATLNEYVAAFTKAMGGQA